MFLVLDMVELRLEVGLEDSHTVVGIVAEIVEEIVEKVVVGDKNADQDVVVVDTVGHKEGSDFGIPQKIEVELEGWLTWLNFEQAMGKRCFPRNLIEY